MALEALQKFLQRLRVDHVLFFRPASSRLSDTEVEEADVVGAVGVGVDDKFHAGVDGFADGSTVRLWLFAFRCARTSTPILGKAIGRLASILPTPCPPA